MKLEKEEILNRLKKINDMEMVEEYKGNVRKYHLFKCNKCCNIFDRRLDHVFSGKGCKYCNHAIKYTVNEVNEKVKCYNFMLVGEYIKNTKKTTWVCTKCNFVFKKSLNEILRGNVHCQKCNPKFYKNENLTGVVLQEMFPDIEIIKSYKLDIPIYYKNKILINYVRIDYKFVLNGKTYFIEYNGQQHYIPIKFWDKTKKEALEKFKKQKIRDKWLRKYCIDNNINLIEINGLQYYGIKIKKFLENKFY